MASSLWGPRHAAGIRGVNAGDIREDLAAVGGQRRRQRDRRSVGGAAAQRDHVSVRAESLKAGDNRNPAGLHLLPHPGWVQPLDAAAAIHPVGDDPSLHATEGHRLLTACADPPWRPRRRTPFHRWTAACRARARRAAVRCARPPRSADRWRRHERRRQRPGGRHPLPRRRRAPPRRRCAHASPQRYRRTYRPAWPLSDSNMRKSGKRSSGPRRIAWPMVQGIQHGGEPAGGELSQAAALEIDAPLSVGDGEPHATRRGAAGHITASDRALRRQAPPADRNRDAHRWRAAGHR